ncbi:MAG: HEAT repeat domain-containing protein [Acidobacteria bacterium]|nr:HEAT repeat domain-containing protein [Acidobacteriota bacterium]
MAEPVTPPLSLEASAQLADFARTCKAAARAVSLYPSAHPAIGISLSRLAGLTARLTEHEPFRLQVAANKLLVGGAAMVRPDPAVSELADLLHRHAIGGLAVSAGADAASWRALLLLLARAPEDVRAEGGIAHLWAANGGQPIEIQEIDYAEVLREKEGLAATIEQIVAAALAGQQVALDDASMRKLLQIIDDPARLDQLMARMAAAADPGGSKAQTAAFLSVLRGLASWASQSDPERLERIFRQMGHAAGRLSADAMVALLAERHGPNAMAGTINVARAVVERMGDASVAQFVAGSVIVERGASARLALAFQSLVPEKDRQRQLLSLAQQEVSASEMGQEDGFPELWASVENMLTSYSDAQYVSEEYGLELSSVRTQAVGVEQTSDDPPERVAAWLATVSDNSVIALDHQLLLDLLHIEEDPVRWRDVSETAATHADDRIRVRAFGEGFQLAEAILREGSRLPGRAQYARAAVERFSGGSMMKQVAAHLRVADDDAVAQFTQLCHAIGTPTIAPLAEALSAETDARARRRLRDILIGFGASGRESVQKLMNAPNWEVRRTAAYLLREFGGAEGLRELIPLLTDSEPLVRREAVQGLMLNGSPQAADMR